MSVEVLAELLAVLLEPLLFERQDLFFFPEFELLEPWLDEPWLDEPWFCVVQLLEVVLLPEDRGLEPIDLNSLFSQ